jgi:glycosidase
MPWHNQPGGGFTNPDTRPWLPLGDVATFNVEDQRTDPNSILVLCRDLIALRRTTADLHTGAYRSLPSPPDVWAWKRGRHVTIAVNLSDTETETADMRGHVAVATNRNRDNETVAGSLHLGPWEGAVLLRS